MEVFLGVIALGFACFWILMILLCLGSVVFSVWMLIDCIQREEGNFKDKNLWMILLALGLFLGYSLIISAVYYFVVKKESDK